MKLVNLTPHSIEVYVADQFEGLEQVNPTTWVADGVSGVPILARVSRGSLRISTSAIESDPVEGVPIFQTSYGDLTGLPEETEGCLFIVSLPAQSMAKQSGHPLSNRMVAPYQVVWLKSNSSTVLGCMGLTY